MSDKMPSSHPLVKMFRWATNKAFRCYPELYDQNVSEHICGHILIEFMRAENLYWLKNTHDHSVDEIPDMIIEGDVMFQAKSMEKELAAQEHIGNFSLFMAGFFPSVSYGIKKGLFPKRRDKDRLFLELYYILHPKEKGLDYYIIQGKDAYTKTSQIYKGINEIKSHLFRKLSRHFEAYAALMQTIQNYLLSPNFDMGLCLCD